MTVHPKFRSTVTQAAKIGAKLGALGLVVSLSACVIAPIGYRHHGGYGYGGQVAVEAAPVVVAPPPPVVVVRPGPQHGYPRYYRY
jgi:hypothetical protein